MKIPLQIIITDVETDYVDMDIKRRTVEVGFKKLVIQEVNKITTW